MSIWNLSPIFVAGVIFFIDFGMILLIRWCFEKRVYITRWWQFRYGDGIFLPLYGYFVALIYQNTQILPTIYLQTWWHISILFLGYIIMLITECLHIKNNVYKTKDLLLASQLYHSFIFGIMFYLVVSTFPIVFLVGSPFFAYIGAIIALGGFISTSIKDLFFDSKKRVLRK